MLEEVARKLWIQHRIEFNKLQTVLSIILMTSEIAVMVELLSQILQPSQLLNNLPTTSLIMFSLLARFKAIPILDTRPV